MSFVTADQGCEVEDSQTINQQSEKVTTGRTISNIALNEKIIPKTQEQAQESPLREQDLKQKMSSTFHLKPPLRAKVKDN